MNKEKILNDFNTVFDALEQAIGNFNNENFNQVPFEGSWTGGQVSQHILLSCHGFVGFLTGNVKLTERPIDQLIPTIKDILLNYQTKLKSPEFIDPRIIDYDREQKLTEVKNVRAAIENEISALDLSQTCVDFELPNLGLMTRLEAIYFVIFHTERHTHQLNNIFKYVK